MDVDKHDTLPGPVTPGFTPGENAVSDDEEMEILRPEGTPENDNQF